CQRFRFRPGRNRRIHQVLEQAVDRFLVVSDALGEVLRANGIRVDATLHNAIEPLANLPDPAEVLAFRERLGLGDARVMAMGGRLHEQKGVGKLLEMLALLAPEFPDLKLLVMGKRDIYEREFRPQAQRLGVAERVVSTGWLDGETLQLAYAAADVFVTPSICFDTFGLVNLEAMQHQKPVVATEFGGSKEVVLDGVTGFIANPFQVADYAERLARLLRDPDLRREMGERGYQRLYEFFTIEHYARACMAQYEAALAGASRPG
ncbi:MAG TPA: glycosyltransferase family 4 protein, partial [Planctomycetota bacterium]|nr:glycosyltransferase family 4 protein [Planctomycetota bacterium]